VITTNVHSVTRGKPQALLLRVNCIKLLDSLRMVGGFTRASPGAPRDVETNRESNSICRVDQCHGMVPLGNLHSECDCRQCTHPGPITLAPATHRAKISTSVHHEPDPASIDCADWPGMLRSLRSLLEEDTIPKPDGLGPWCKRQTSNVSRLISDRVRGRPRTVRLYSRFGLAIISQP